jgi:phenylpropionate dioxygenase-like ring-hydroxylating dioxygenase large terminal subunit
MLKREDNELITRVNPGTPMGDVMRRYWMPALLSSELPQPDSDPVRVRLLGEDLVAFRDSNGQVGLLQNNCPHRGASLFFGRNEEAGMRCVYHGWKFDTSGQCIDMPNEPAESDFRTKVKAIAYPTIDKAGVVWAYLGPAENQPPLPDFEWMRAPEGHSWISKTYQETNYLQAMEGGLDTSHSSFLHRDLDRDGLSNPRVRSTAPRLEVLNTDYGYMYASIRHLPEDKQNFVRVYHYVMPFYQLRAGGAPNTLGHTDGHMWVPIDDVTCWAWNFHCSTTTPLTYERWQHYEHGMGRGLAEDFVPGTFKLKANASNDYGLSRERQRTVNYTGIEGTNTQDFAVQESMGPIYDRTQEHLGSADTAIIQMRRLLLDAVRDVSEGRDPVGAHSTGGNAVRPAQMYLPEDARWAETRLKDALVAQY